MSRRPWWEGNPACWRWKVPTATEVARLREKAVREGLHEPISEEYLRWRLMGEMHKDRCAICGRRTSQPRKDHDHPTGLIRGWLCPSCNTSEGCSRSDGTIYAKYRAIHPALMCGVREVYHSGWGVLGPVSFAPFGRPQARWRAPTERDSGLGVQTLADVGCVSTAFGAVTARRRPRRPERRRIGS